MLLTMRNGAQPQSRVRRPPGAEQKVAVVGANRLQIGEVARQTEVSVETVRFYEARGLISPPHAAQADTVSSIPKWWIRSTS